MNNRFNFRAWYNNEFIYIKNLTDTNYYNSDNKCLGLVNTLPNDLTWEQCTGILDKNEKLVYENDILKIYTNRFLKYFYVKIIWDNKLARFMVKNNCIYTTLDELYSYFETVGNIHQNPKLME